MQRPYLRVTDMSSGTRNPKLPGLHHVTAITADAQKNIDFYCGVLGLRLVKITVNFDDPTTYHLYYGDELGRPGTLVTFFVWREGRRGRAGAPQVTSIAFAVPEGALEFWRRRLEDHLASSGGLTKRFGENVLRLQDPDGVALELVAVAAPEGEPWARFGVPGAYAIRRIHAVSLSEEGYEATAKILTEWMGFKQVAKEGNRFRYRPTDSEGACSFVDVICMPDGPHGSMGAGVVHHVAFRTPDDAQQIAWRARMVEAGLNVSPVMDRSYFHSIYYREPGGVLFEIATDAPGFTVDETRESLGTTLKLPAQYEHARSTIEAKLPELHLPRPSSQEPVARLRSQS